MEDSSSRQSLSASSPLDSELCDPRLAMDQQIIRGFRGYIGRYRRISVDSMSTSDFRDPLNFATAREMIIEKSMMAGSAILTVLQILCTK